MSANVPRSHYQVHGGPLLTAFTHLCMSLVFDLGLHRPPLQGSYKTVRCLTHVHSKYNPLRLGPWSTGEQSLLVIC